MTKTSWTKVDRPDVEEYVLGEASLYWDDNSGGEEGWVLRVPGSTDEPIDAERNEVAWAQEQAEMLL